MPQPDALARPSHGAEYAAGISLAAEKREKARDARPLRRLLPYLFRRRGDVALAGVFLVVATMASLAMPLAFRNVIDHGFVVGAADAVDRAFLGLGGVAVVMAIASAARFYFVSKIGERVVSDLRADVYDHLLSLSPGYFARVRTGEVLSRLTVDAALIETLIGSSASMATRAMLTLVGAAVMLAVTNLQLAGLLLLVLPLVMAPILLFGRRVRGLSVAAQDRVADASAAAAESIDAIDTVQAFGREDDMRARFRSAVENAFAAARRRIQARAHLTAGAIGLMFLGVTLVLWLGARSVLAAEMTPGALAQFVLFAILAAGNGAMLSEVWGDVLKASGATDRLTAILAETPDIAAPANPVALPTPGRGALRFERVSFAYPDSGERSALREFSLDVRPGETVALVGPSGAGKSTVFRLLLRFYDPQGGGVFLDDVEARSADPRAWRQRFSYVSQDAHLFSGSAADNIRLGRPDADAEAIERAARRAEAWSFLAMRGGLDASVGDRGRALSGGERQRLALARALARDAPVLLLDEATSALDAQNERLVQAALAEARKGRTTLVIAHRLATVLEADRIVVMDQGRVVEQGAHTELVARGGLYAQLAAMQFMDAA
ncbi:MAG: ABC transporter transmembrane domain-containing protein [Hyphomonadaceae bacterium]|nr:ABC transporter transmembrane domain-containing protein [Hyphomonadaceae bacterium]